MDFDLTHEQQMLRDLAREFARRAVAPAAAQYDRAPAFPRALFEEARSLGLLNVGVPEEFGGGGLGAFEQALISEQLAWACTGIGSALGLNRIVVDALVVGGSEVQKRTYLRRLTDGECGAYTVTEPGAGSDVAALQARAERRGGEYVINGSKTWISNATEATFFVVFVRTGPGDGHRGLSAFIVERDRPGLTVGRKLPKMGQRASPAAEVFFADVVVPASARLGGEGDGFAIAMGVFDRSRPGVAAAAVGLTARCLDESLAHATTRTSMGRPIIEHQAVGHKIAEMGMRLEASRLVTWEAAWLLDRGRRNTFQAACAKALAADTAMWAAGETLQIFGGMGYSEEFPAEKLFRDAKVLQIYEGTSEIQRSIIARELAARLVHNR